MRDIESDDKVSVYSITDYKLFRKNCTDDKILVKKLADELSKADIWVTWYGTYFDVPYLNSRLLYHGLDPLPPVPHVDGWRIARNRLKLHSNRLASVSAFLGLDDKTQLLQDQWRKAAAGYRDAIKYVKEHCAKDVVVLEQAYNKLKTLSSDHPNVSLIPRNDGTTVPGCSTCGKPNGWIRRGYSIARTSRRQRFQCKFCGHWGLGKAERIKGIEVR